MQIYSTTNLIILIVHHKYYCFPAGIYLVKIKMFDFLETENDPYFRTEGVLCNTLRVKAWSSHVHDHKHHIIS